MGTAADQAPLLLYGVCSVVGATALYHFNYDNIKLFPALLASLGLALQRPSLGSLVPSVLLAGTLWVPQRLLDALPFTHVAQPLIWSAVGLVLLAQMMLMPAPRSDQSHRVAAPGTPVGSTWRAEA